jgi:hypothetical protein
MTRRLLTVMTLLGVVWVGVGCGGSSAPKSSPPTVPDPNGITIPKPAGGGGPKAG